MSRFKLLYFVISIINLCIINAQISDKRLCVDEECKVPISLARTLLRYSSPDSRILSFAPNVDITIYSKSAGSREDLWGGEINGKRGYVPKHLVRETKILQKPTILVDTEFSNETEAKVPLQVEPNRVQEAYEVVDGTTIYLSPQDTIDTSTDSPVQPTALPNSVIEPSTISTPNIVSNEQTLPKDESLKVESSGKQQEQVKDEGLVVGENAKQSQEMEKVSEVNADVKNDQETHEEDDSDDEDDLIDVDEDGDDEAEWENEDEDEEDAALDTPTENVEIITEKNLSDTVKESNEEHTSVDDKKNIPDAVKASSEENKSEDVKTGINFGVAAEQLTEQISPNQGAESIQEKESVAGSEETILYIEEVEETTPKPEAVEEPKPNQETTAKQEPTKEVPPFQPTEGPVQAEENTLKQEPAEETTPTQEPAEETTPTQEPAVETKPKQEQPEETKPKQEPSEETKAQESVVPPIQPTEGPVENETVQSLDPLIAVNDAIEETVPQVNSEEDATTISPEIEVPNPFEDIFAEVTPNPLESMSEEIKIMENIVSALPPLGLFSSLNDGSSETVAEVEGTETVAEVEGTETAKPQNEEDIIDSTNDSEVSFEEINENTEEGVDDLTSSENNSQEIVEDDENKNEDSGFFSGIFSLFGSTSEEETKDKSGERELTSDQIEEKLVESEDYSSKLPVEQHCEATTCPTSESGGSVEMMDFFNFNSDVFLYLVTTAISVIIFLFGYIAFDKSKREGPLVAKINSLEKQLLIVIKENQILQEKIAGDSGCDTNDRVSSEVVENLKQDLLEVTRVKNAFEEQIQSLEKELENSTEVGMELNRMLSEILSSESGSDVVRANVEHLQKQLVEQQATINSINDTLTVTNTENYELKLEVELSNKKIVDLQAELDKLLLNVLKLEEEKELQQNALENEVTTYKQRLEEANDKMKIKEEEYGVEIKQLKNRLYQTERDLQLKIKEHDVLADTIKQLKAVKNDGLTLQKLLDATSIKAEVQLLKSENQQFIEKLQQEEGAKLNHEKRAQAAVEEIQRLKQKYDEADKLKVETETKLEVLSNYFKEREAQLQKEIARHESLWVEKQGEATSTTERVKFMQEQLQNYKSQTESLKQEIVSQEVELKSQISVLEKKVHENWVSARQAERKLEDAKQEAAQLRHRLTLRERALHEDKSQQRFQSPIEQNGDMPVSPLESPASPPLLYGARDHITKSPPIPGLPPFLPPPPGVPFMPPPLHGVPPFIPPPPTMFPGDHRPPPLGRMSSPPLNSRYSPSSRGYSPYDSSPSDSEYGTSPPQRRGYSPFNSRGEDRRDYKRPPPGRSNGRNIIKDGVSSGSGNSNESLEKINRQQSKV